MNRLIARLLRPESGQALVLAVFAIAAISTAAVALSDLVTSEVQSSGQAISTDSAYQAAEAGIDAYASKLLDDHLYYLHYVAEGESTRVSGSIVAVPGQGTGVPDDTPWTGGVTWSYPYGQDNWRYLDNGYAYNLEITGPSGSATPQQQAIQIVSTGCRWNIALGACGTAANNATRTIQTLLLPSSIASFQMLSNATISYGKGATTNGKLFSNGDIVFCTSAAVSATYCTSGNSGAIGVNANAYAEGRVRGAPTLGTGAAVYDSTTTPSVSSIFPGGINFADFLTSISDIQRAAETNNQPTNPTGGVYLDQSPAPSAWEVVFNANGTFTAAACTKVGSADVSQIAPTCGAATTYNMPANGAIYSDQTVIVGGPGTASSTVNGRVTITSNNNIVIGNNIAYASGTNSILGMVALNNVIVAYWVPSNLTWTGATIATSGVWADTCDPRLFSYGCGTHQTMTFTGSTATYNGGSMSMFQTRSYNYDPNLLWLLPPWFPTVSKPYTVLLQREIPS